jgi:hypothetical protein
VVNVGFKWLSRCVLAIKGKDIQSHHLLPDDTAVLTRKREKVQAKSQDHIQMIQYQTFTARGEVKNYVVTGADIMAG